MTVYLLLVLMTQYADYWTTKRVLAQGGRELNPISRTLIYRLGMTHWLIMKLGLGFVLVTATWPLIWPSAAAILITGVIAIRNYRMIR